MSSKADELHKIIGAAVLTPNFDALSSINEIILKAVMVSRTEVFDIVHRASFAHLEAFSRIQHILHETTAQQFAVFDSINRLISDTTAQTFSTFANIQRTIDSVSMSPLLMFADLQQVIGNITALHLGFPTRFVFQIDLLDTIHARVRGIHFDDLQKLMDSVEADGEEVELNDDLFASFEDMPTTQEASTWTLDNKVDYLLARAHHEDRQAWRKFWLGIIVSLLKQYGIQALLTLVTIAGVMEYKPVAKIVRAVQELLHKIQVNPDVRILRCRSNVMEASHRNSRVVCILDAGQAVNLLEKRKRWAHIEWTDLRTGSVKSGWVLSKRLQNPN